MKKIFLLAICFSANVFSQNTSIPPNITIHNARSSSYINIKNIQTGQRDVLISPIPGVYIQTPKWITGDKDIPVGNDPEVANKIEKNKELDMKTSQEKAQLEIKAAQSKKSPEYTEIIDKEKNIPQNHSVSDQFIKKEEVKPTVAIVPMGDINKNTIDTYEKYGNERAMQEYRKFLAQ